MVHTRDVAVVVIGRNEGERLRLSLMSLQGVKTRVYVDSGSIDASQSVASRLGFELVQLTTPPGFTAARARNAGLRKVLELNPEVKFVQMVDGDCEVASGWLAIAYSELEKTPGVAAVFGRRRERYPNATIYNMICDDEWDVPVGEARSCGGDVMFRVSALLEVGGYTDSLIAGEEPDLCLRLREKNWTIVRIPAEMTVHDVAISRFSQWWTRAKRAGFAFAELVHRHGTHADPIWIRQLGSMSGWGGVGILGTALVVAGLLLGEATPTLLGSVLGAIFIIQWLRLVWRRYATGMPLKRAIPWAYLIMLSKFAQLQGAIQYHWTRLTGATSKIFEYKS